MIGKFLITYLVRLHHSSNTLLKHRYCEFSYKRKLAKGSFPIVNSYRYFMQYNYPIKMKIDTPEFRFILTPELQTLVGLFKKHDYEIRIAGGAVRDILLGIVPKDIDFATTATPEQMKTMFEIEDVRMINMKGEKHGTITARINKENFEITTLRIDVTTDGRHAEVEFTTNWMLDANRRDLTINSMFLGIDGLVYDYFGGYEDLIQRKVIFVGNATSRIREDYLRILRYFRFYGRIAQEIDKHDVDTLKAISENISGLKKISGERIWMELSKILSGRFVSNIVSRLLSVGASPFIGLPESPNQDELQSVWEQGKNLDMHPITLLSALMNNVNDMMNFHGRCKLSTYERNLGLFIIEHRREKQLLKSVQVLMFRTEGNTMDSKEFIIELLKYKCDLNLIHEFKSWDPPKFPLNGHIVKQCHVPPGKPIGRVMKKCKDYWVEKDFQPSEKELVAMIPIFMDELGIQRKE